MVATIEYIEQVIETYRKAAEANRQTPTRKGNVVVLTREDADDVMITADLHGNRRNFNAIRTIAALDANPRRHLILQEVCHGGPTYPNSGGCMSHTMLEDVARLKARYPDRVHFLLSNHELAELTDYPIVKSGRMLNLLFRLGMQEIYGPATEKVRQAYADFLRSLPLAVSLPGGVFVCHTLPEEVDRHGFETAVFERPLEPLDLREHGVVFKLVWGRDFREENAQAFAGLVGASVLIHGHEPCGGKGFCVPNQTQIILDCCSQQAGYLILPTDVEWTHEKVVERIRDLGEGSGQ